MSACVYLIHITGPPGANGRRHFLAVDDQTANPALPAVVWYGAGTLTLPAEAAIVDVWECDGAIEAEGLYRRLARQGGRARLCSVCSPGNGRGGGRGKYQRKGRSL